METGPTNYCDDGCDLFSVDGVGRWFTGCTIGQSDPGGQGIGYQTIEWRVTINIKRPSKCGLKVGDVCGVCALCLKRYRPLISFLSGPDLSDIFTRLMASLR